MLMNTLNWISLVISLILVDVTRGYAVMQSRSPSPVDPVDIKAALQIRRCGSMQDMW
jgi:hypothetical protein